MRLLSVQWTHDLTFSAGRRLIATYYLFLFKIFFDLGPTEHVIILNNNFNVWGILKILNKFGNCLNLPLTFLFLGSYLHRFLLGHEVASHLFQSSRPLHLKLVLLVLFCRVVFILLFQVGVLLLWVVFLYRWRIKLWWSSSVSWLLFFIIVLLLVLRILRSTLLDEVIIVVLFPYNWWLNLWLFICSNFGLSFFANNTNSIVWTSLF